MAKKSKLGLGVVIGGLIGFIVGIFSAPKSGKESREDVHKQLKQVKKSTEAKLKDVYKELDAISKQAKLQAKRTEGKALREIEAVSAKADKMKVRLKEAITVVKQDRHHPDETNFEDVLNEVKQFIGDMKVRLVDAKDYLKAGEHKK